MPFKGFLFKLAREERTQRLGGCYWWFSILLWIAFVAPAQALQLRVAIENGVKQVKLGSSTKAIVRDGSGRTLGEIAPMNGFIAQPYNGKVALGNWQSGQISIEPIKGGYVWIGDRWYRGRARIVPTNKGLTAVNQVDLEQYLYSVLGAEMDGNWPLEALKAQAVAARTYALYKRQSSANSVYDLGSTQASQVYKGLQTESQRTLMAVSATNGQVLTYRGKIILAAFHSASGGHTENVEDVWSDPLPYLRGVPDYDQGTPGYQWVKNFSPTELGRRLGLGIVRSVIPERITRYGSAIAVKVVSDRGTRSLSGTQLRERLGLRSTRFTVTSTPTAFQINGRGFGHAIGMSQWGAYKLAKSGANYQQILLHYYRGATLAKIKG